MTLDEIIADYEAKRDALRFRLLLIAHSVLPDDVRNERLTALTAEIQTLRATVLDSIRSFQKRP